MKSSEPPGSDEALTIIRTLAIASMISRMSSKACRPQRCELAMRWVERNLPLLHVLEFLDVQWEVEVFLSQDSIPVLVLTVSLHWYAFLVGVEGQNPNTRLGGARVLRSVFSGLGVFLMICVRRSVPSSSSSDRTSRAAFLSITIGSTSSTESEEIATARSGGNNTGDCVGQSLHEEL